MWTEPEDSVASVEARVHGLIMSGGLPPSVRVGPIYRAYIFFQLESCLSVNRKGSLLTTRITSTGVLTTPIGTRISGR